MSIFASKTPRDLNPHGVIMTGAGALPLCLCGWQRRRLDGPTLAEHIAEFDHVQHNKPNPILVELRRQNHDWSHKYAGVHAFYAANSTAWVRAGMPDDTSGSEWAEFERHAYKVTTRLANLAQIGA